MIKIISVVIPNYNGSAYLETCINSLLDISDLGIEIIVVDNGSTDADYNWIKNYPIHFRKLDYNYGFSKAINEGIKSSKGEYVLLLNNDTIIEKGFIEELIYTIKQDKKIFGVGSKMIQYHYRDLIDDAGDEYTLFGWTRKRGDGESVQNYIKSQKVFSVCAGAALYRKSIFEEIGYFDENFFAYMEDVDISYRAIIYGYKNIYCPDAKVYHIGSATSGAKYNAFKVRLAARNNIYVPYKNMPLLQLIINMPFLCLGYFIKYLFFIKKGLGTEYAQGVFEGIRTLHKIKKVPFRINNTFNYFYIEYLLFKNTVMYFINILKKLII